MDQDKAKEELIKDKIFSCYSESLNNPFRQQVFLGQLSDLIFRWCKNYLNFNIDNIGEEIFNIAERLLRKDSKANIPKDKEGFIKYLLAALGIGKNEYIKKYVSKDKKDVIRMKESFIGRKLTEAEKDNVITQWFEDEISESLNIDLLIDSNTTIIYEAVKTVLEKKQDRSRDCYRALFTLHCIENEYAEDIYQLLDQEIIDSFHKNNIKPTQYEIWQKYHIGVSKGGAEAQASLNLKNFLKDLKSYLKEKNPEIFH